jgi:hypothetical protein
VLSGVMELLRLRKLSMLIGNFQVLLNVAFEKLFWEFPTKRENFIGKTTKFFNN